MDIHIRAKPYFILPLKRIHIDALTVMSQHHYDARCRMASERGGFIYGWNNMLMGDEDFDNVEGLFNFDASIDDSQTIMKILESIRLCENASLITPNAATLCRELDRDLLRAYRLSDDLRNEWQSVYEAD